jgi:predicted nucleic acid-binding protein
MNAKPTLDTNILIYAFGKKDDARKESAIEVIKKCNIVSIQVVNESIYVPLKKFNFPINELEKVIEFMKQNFIISDLNSSTLELTIKISARYGFSFWDSMIVASALSNHCTMLFSEDMHHSQIIEGKLEIINPFKN